MFKKYFKFFLIALFIIAWFWSWWNRSDPHNWLLENEIVFFSLIFIFLFAWMLRLSNLSLALTTMFLILHVIGAHYNYGSVPFGIKIGNLLGTHTNSYDKFVHFCFGFLMFYPIRELFLRVSNLKGFWTYFFPFNIILSLSALYEIMEWLSTLGIDPHSAYLFIGGTDPFDAPKDMASATLGALATIIIVGIIQANKDKDFWGKIKRSIKRDKREIPSEDAFIHKPLT